jgi:hypothetical protein
MDLYGRHSQAFVDLDELIRAAITASGGSEDEPVHMLAHYYNVRSLGQCTGKNADDEWVDLRISGRRQGEYQALLDSIETWHGRINTPLSLAVLTCAQLAAQEIQSRDAQVREPIRTKAILASRSALAWVEAEKAESMANSADRRRQLQVITPSGLLRELLFIGEAHRYTTRLFNRYDESRYDEQWRQILGDALRKLRIAEAKLRTVMRQDGQDTSVAI